MDLRVVSVQTFDELGGGEYANVDLLEALAERGAHVSLLTNQPRVAEGTRVPARVVDLGPKLRKATLWRVVVSSPRGILRLRRALRQEAAERPVDVTLLHYKKEQLWSMLLPRRLTGRVAWAEWGPLPSQFRRGTARWLYALAARRAERILCVSETTAASVAAAGVSPEKLGVVPNVLHVDRLAFDPAARARWRAAWGIDDTTFVIGCIARLNRRKRVDVLLDALDELDADVLVVVAGDGPEAEALRARAAHHGDRVRWVRSIRGQAAEFLSACDVAVFTPQETEGTPRSVALAMLTERPLVATGPAGAELLGRGTGTVLDPPNDPAALARSLRAYHRDPDRRLREGRTARVRALATFDRRTVVDSAVASLSEAA